MTSQNQSFKAMESPNNKRLIEKKDIHGSRSIQPPKIDGSYVVDEISNVLSFKKGILNTIRELFLRPGQSIRAFIHEDRSKLVKPVMFVIFCSLFYAILQQFIEFEERFFDEEAIAGEPTVVTIIKWVQANYGYANLVMSIFVAFWAKILFRKSGYNFFEVLTLIFYIFGMVMLISAFFGVLDAIFPYKIIYLGGIFTFLYPSWVMGQFFNGRKIPGYFKGFLSYTLGLFSATLMAFLLGYLIDMFL